MMANATDYLEQALLNHIFRGEEHTANGGAEDNDFPQPAAVYVALFTADPTDAGNLANEVSTTGTGYSRQQVSFGSPIDNGAGGYKVSNDAVVTFTASGANWGTITHFAIMDAASGGNMLAHGSLSSSKPVNDGDSIEFAAGTLEVSLS